MPVSKNIISPTADNEQRNSWFAQIVHSIAITKLKLDTQTATVEEAYIYDSASRGDVQALAEKVQEQTRSYFVSIVLNDFIRNLRNADTQYNQIAFDFSGSTVLAWVQIEDFDEGTKDKIILAEAEANARMVGIRSDTRLRTMITEIRDCQSIPPHFVQPESPLNIL